MMEKGVCKYSMGEPSKIQVLISYLTNWFPCSPSQGVQRTSFVIHRLIGGTFRSFTHLPLHIPGQSDPDAENEKVHSIYNIVLILALIYIYEPLIISSISATSFTAVVKLT